MSKDMRRWPWNDSYEDDNYLEPYDEYEDVRNKGEDEWGNI